MISSSLQSAINDQIQAEFGAAHMYLQMSAYFETENFLGFAKWMRKQWQEEIEHGMKFFDFMVDRNGDVKLKNIPEPKGDFKSPLDVFEKSLKHEENVTKMIYRLYEMAEKEKDYALKTFLHWFIDEQVEEEKQANDMVGFLKLANNDTAAILRFDHEAGKRGA